MKAIVTLIDDDGRVVEAHTTVNECSCEDQVIDGYKIIEHAFRFTYVKRIPISVLPQRERKTVEQDDLSIFTKMTPLSPFKKIEE